MATLLFSRNSSFLAVLVVYVLIGLLSNIASTSAQDNPEPGEEVFTLPSIDLGAAKELLGLGLTIFIVIIVAITVVIITIICACVYCCTHSSRRKRMPPTVIQGPALGHEGKAQGPPYEGFGGPPGGPYAQNDGAGVAYRGDQGLPRATAYSQQQAPQQQQYQQYNEQIQQMQLLQHQLRQQQMQERQQQHQLFQHPQSPVASEYTQDPYEAAMEPTVAAKPNRSDAAWKAVTDQVKDLQKQHSFSYTNYGYAANIAAGPPVEKA